MTTFRCPFCASEKVYSLLDTFHCKRCKNMWKADEKNPDRSIPYGRAGQISSHALRTTQKTDTLEKRMEKRRDNYLRMFHGSFCMDTIAWKNADFSKKMFLTYLRTCVKNKVLAEKKERYGKIWYFKNTG